MIWKSYHRIENGSKKKRAWALNFYIYDNDSNTSLIINRTSHCLSIANLHHPIIRYFLYFLVLHLKFQNLKIVQIYIL